MKIEIKKNRIILLITLMFSILNHIKAQPNYPSDPQQAIFIYSDLENFKEAYDHLNAGVDTIQILNTFYFEKASVGLREYIGKHKLTPEMLKKAIVNNKEKYDQISSFIDGLILFKQRYSETMQKYKEVIPDAMFPPTYLLVGANRGIGQGSRYGQLVTITKVLDNEELLLKLIVHELSHFQQARVQGFEKYIALYSSPNNMLGLCLREGGAEFITSLVLQDITKAKALKYLNENEKELKTRFKEDLLTQNQKFWLWESLNQNKYPNLLGYVMGLKINQSFYENSIDKDKALHVILKSTNPEDILKKSGYLTN